MQSKYKNKQTTSETKSKQDFHFSGGGEYAPITIVASSYEEALEIWKKKRVKIKP